MTEINIKSTTIEKGLDLAKEFVQSVMKPSLDEVGELFADKVKLWRVKNQIRNIEKVKAIVEKEGIKTKAINMKVLFPYLDAVALEDDETLQDMWANLLANYIDSEKNLSVTVYPHILKQLSRNEAQLLKEMYNDIAYDKVKSIHDPKNYHAIEINNMVRLGLLTDEYLHKAHNHSNMLIIENKNNTGYAKSLKFYLSLFGGDFLLACTRDKETEE